MARLFGFIGNRPDVGAKLLEAQSGHLETQSQGAALGWGVGFYQGSDVLLRRRPLSTQGRIEVPQMLGGVRATELIGHIGPTLTDSARTETTQPFRYRNWLFALSGTLENSVELRHKLRDSLPEFLRCNVRGDTARELVFHMFLSFLEDAGQLHQTEADLSEVRAALRCSVALVERLTTEVGAVAPQLNALVTNGEFLMAVHGGGRMAYRVLQEQADYEALLVDSSLAKPSIRSVESCRFSLLVAGAERELPDFTKVADRSIITLDRINEPRLDSLDARSALHVAAAA